jgi:hypothetical protein
MSENRHKAIFEGNCGFGPSTAACTDGNASEGVRIIGDFVTIAEITVRAGTHNIDVSGLSTDAIIDDVISIDPRARAVSIEGDNVIVRNSVLGYYQDNSSTVAIVDPIEGIRFNQTSAGAQILNTAVISVNQDGTAVMNDEFGGDGHTSGIAIHIGEDVPKVIMRGNILMYTYKDGFRIFRNCNEHVFTDNICAHGINCWSARDQQALCSPARHTMSNNFLIGNATAWGGKGAHSANNSYEHNTIVITKFTNEGGARSARNEGEFDEDQIFRSNLFFNPVANEGGTSQNGYLALIFNYGEAFSGTPNTSCADGCKTHNMYWWNWNTGANNWVYAHEGGNWGYDSTEIASFGTPPIFVDQSAGDYRLANGSTGKNRAHDGTDVGIAVNSHLTVAKMQAVVGSLNGVTEQSTSGTSAAVTGLDPIRWYSVYTRHPASGACSNTSETYTIEGRTLRYINYSTAGEKWRGVHFPHGKYSGGAHRWLQLGEHAISGDGTLNIAWQTPSCVDRVAAIPVPTPSEASCWLNASECAGEAQSLTASATVNAGEIFVSWASVPGATNYRLYVATAPGGSYNILHACPSVSYLHTGLGSAVQRCYKVASVVGGIESPQSSEVCATTL